MSKDTISISIPKKPEYISTLRLAASSIGNNISLNIDDIEDVKVSLGEACINSLITKDKKEMSIVFEIEKEKLVIKVSDTVEKFPEDLEEKRDRELGLVIIESLMDEVNFSSTGIEMTKYIEVDD